MTDQVPPVAALRGALEAWLQSRHGDDDSEDRLIDAAEAWLGAIDAATFVPPITFRDSVAAGVALPELERVLDALREAGVSELVGVTIDRLDGRLRIHGRPS